jgi:hypothetical protein
MATFADVLAADHEFQHVDASRERRELICRE